MVWIEKIEEKKKTEFWCPCKGPICLLDCWWLCTCNGPGGCYEACTIVQ